MLEHVLAANVYDERELGLERRNIGEILVRSNADINAVFSAAFVECVEHVEVGGFIGDVVVTPEIAALFGKSCDEIPKLAIADAFRLAAARRQTGRRDGRKRCRDGDR